MTAAIIAIGFGNGHVEVPRLHARARIDLGEFFEARACRLKDRRDGRADQRVLVRAAFRDFDMAGSKKPGQPLAAIPVKGYFHHALKG